MQNSHQPMSRFDVIGSAREQSRTGTADHLLPRTRMFSP